MLPQWLIHQELIYEAFFNPCAYTLEAKFESAYLNSDATVKSGTVPKKSENLRIVQDCHPGEGRNKENGGRR